MSITITTYFSKAVISCTNLVVVAFHAQRLRWISLLLAYQFCYVIAMHVSHLFLLFKLNSHTTDLVLCLVMIRENNSKHVASRARSAANMGRHVGLPLSSGRREVVPPAHCQAGLLMQHSWWRTLV